MFRLMIFLLIASSLAGCGTSPKWLDNRLACTVNKDTAFVVSRYGPLGIASTLAGEDAAVVCAR